MSIRVCFRFILARYASQSTVFIINKIFLPKVVFIAWYFCVQQFVAKKKKFE